MMMYISFFVQYKTGELRHVTINVRWRTTTMTTVTVFVKILLIPLSKTYLENTIVSSAHHGTHAVSISYGSIAQLIPS